MRKHLDNLRAKHPNVRTQVAVTAAFTATAVMVLIWLTTLPVRFDDLAQNNINTAAAIEAAGEAVSPQTQAFQASLESFQALTVEPNPQSNVPTDVAPSAEEYPSAVYPGTE